MQQTRDELDCAHHTEEKANKELFQKKKENEACNEQLRRLKCVL